MIIVLMIIGGHSGSTSSGLKLYRVYSLYRAIVWKINRQFLSAHVVTEPSLWQGERQHFLSERQLLNISLYVLLYLGVLILGTGILSAYGYSLEASLFEYTSALSTVGLSVGVTSLDSPTGLLWAEIIGMLLGRLEIVTVLVGTLQMLKDGTATGFDSD